MATNYRILLKMNQHVHVTGGHYYYYQYKLSYPCLLLRRLCSGVNLDSLLHHPSWRFEGTSLLTGMWNTPMLCKSVCSLSLVALVVDVSAVRNLWKAKTQRIGNDRDKYVMYKLMKCSILLRCLPLVLKLLLQKMFETQLVARNDSQTGSGGLPMPSIPFSLRPRFRFILVRRPIEVRVTLGF